jgi:hypothetical protein
MQNCAGVERRVSDAIAINDSLRNRILSALHRSITPDVALSFAGRAMGWGAAARYAKQAQNTSNRG